MNTFMPGVDGAGHRGTPARRKTLVASSLQRFFAIVIACTMAFGGIALAVPLASADAGVPTTPDDNGSQPAVTANLNLRAAPTLDAEILDVIPSGSAIDVLGTAENGFYPVAFNGQQGYSHGDFISGVASSPTEPADPDAPAPENVPVGDVPTGTATVTADRLNFRGGPGLDYSIVTVISEGAVVELRGDAQNNFHPISYDGNTGWVSGDYLVFEGAAPEEPAEDPATEVPTEEPATEVPTEEPATEVPTEEPATEEPTEEPATEVPTEEPATEVPTEEPNEPPVDGSDGYTEDEIIQIIYAAADMYGQPREDMLRVARCESNLDPNAVNPSSNASGLFQFLPSTWETTPYADQDIFDPVANAEAAAWMWSEGRRGEWVCQ